MKVCVGMNVQIEKCLLSIFTRRKGQGLMYALQAMYAFSASRLHLRHRWNRRHSKRTVAIAVEGCSERDLMGA